MKIAKAFILILMIPTAAFAGVAEESLNQATKTFEGLNRSLNKQCAPIQITDTKSCHAVESLKIEIEKAIDRKDWEGKRELENQLTINYEECLADRFKKCYPDLKKSIPLNELSSLFKTLKQDPRFRYPNGGVGMCHYRAENLSYYLAEAGFKTKTIRIDHAPTLIAMDRNPDGSFNGNYDNYHGYHTLVQIEVKVNGKTVPYLLDPQYMEEALPKQDYFLRTMGQNCQHLKSKEDKFRDLTQCYYFEQAQNKTAEDLLTKFYTADAEEDQPFRNCGWGGGQKAKSVNGNTPQKFKEQKVSESTYKDLIQESYDSYEAELKQQLEFANEQVTMSKQHLDHFTDKTSVWYKEHLDAYQSWKTRQENIQYSLERIPEMKKRVEKNLEKLP